MGDPSSPVFFGSEQGFKQFFCERYGYGLPEGSLLDRMRFISSDAASIQCERYGGIGLEYNLGGGRAGDVNGFQVKGIGPTPMVGRRTGQEHGYGGLDAEKAIIETIYSQALGRLLPASTVSCHGIVFVGQRHYLNTG